MLSLKNPEHAFKDFADHIELVCQRNGLRGTQLLWTESWKQPVSELFSIVISRAAQLFVLLCSHGSMGSTLALVPIHDVEVRTIYR